MPSHRTEWVKSSYSGQNGECLETRLSTTGIDVRDSKAIPGPWLTFAPTCWSAFLHGLTTNVLNRAEVIPLGRRHSRL